MATGTSASATSEGSATNERNVEVAGGWPMLLLNIAVLCTGPALVVYGAVHAPANGAAMTAGFALAGALVLAAGFIMTFGFFALQPNEARVLILLGAYHGTVRRSGFHELAIDLIAEECGRVPFRELLVAHRGPHVRVDDVDLFDRTNRARERARGDVVRLAEIREL